MNISLLNKKSSLFVILIFAMVLIFSVNIFAKTSIKLSNQLPSSHHISKSLELFASKVDEYSQGKIEIKLFPSAQLFKDTEIVEAIQEGNIELGLVPVNKWSGMIPAAEIFEMPFVFSELDSIEKTINAGAGELLDKAFQKKGAKVVFWVDYGFVQYFNSKRPIKKPEDFNGLKIRTFSNATAETVKALGGTPVVMSSSEMYMALQRGTVDGATTGMPAAVSRKIYEVQKYLTICNYSTAQFMVQANLDWWNDQSEETKQILIKAGKDAEKWLRGEIMNSERSAQKVIEEAGLDIYVLLPEERKVFIKTTESVRKNYTEKTGELGEKLLEIAFNVQ